MRLITILVYGIEDEGSKLISLAKKIQKDTGYDIVYVGTYIKWRGNIINNTSAGIEDFLSLFKYAKYVVSKSFHGTAFAVVFHKQFLAYSTGTTSTRITDFLEQLGLSKRYIENIEDYKQVYNKIGYSQVDFRLEKLRQQSLEYVKGIIVGTPI